MSKAHIGILSITSCRLEIPRQTVSRGRREIIGKMVPGGDSWYGGAFISAGSYFSGILFQHWIGP
jgi:hypothetical protein